LLAGRDPVSAGLRGWTARGLPTLLVAAFVTVQVVALSHEAQHILHQHDEPCGLHVVAEHLAMAAAPEPAVAVALMPVADPVLLPPSAPMPSLPRSSGARSPPFLV
jgi:hypothetical protein